MTQTIIGYFDTPDYAYNLESTLRGKGMDESSCQITIYDASQEEQSAEEIRNFLSDIFGPENSEEIDYYADEISQGGALLAVDLSDEADTEPVRDAMLEAGAADTSTLRPTEDEDQSIQMIEEDMEVGKRKVGKGSVQVSSRLVETPVQEKVKLREEKAAITRRPVDRPVSSKDIEAMGERSIEVEETAERPVISKSARVVEEIDVGKETSQRTETVKGTVRHTELDVERQPTKKGAKDKKGK